METFNYVTVLLGKGRSGESWHGSEAESFENMLRILQTVEKEYDITFHSWGITFSEDDPEKRLSICLFELVEILNRCMIMARADAAKIDHQIREAKAS